jgi:hypothetical protein
MNGQILPSFIGSILALLSAGIVWVIKAAHSKHVSEITALSKYEKVCALNIRYLSDNLMFIEEWLVALSKNRPYSFHVLDLVTNDDDIHKISNRRLLNKLIVLNYMMRRTSLDLQNLYKGYWETVPKIDSITDPTQREENITRYHATVSSALIKMKGGYPVVKEELIESIAFIRVVAGIRKHSLFGYLNFLFMDIIPRFTEKKLCKHLDALKSEMQLKKL